jgi:hypothetical protein
MVKEKNISGEHEEKKTGFLGAVKEFFFGFATHDHLVLPGVRASMGDHDRCLFGDMLGVPLIRSYALRPCHTCSLAPGEAQDVEKKTQRPLIDGPDVSAGQRCREKVFRVWCLCLVDTGPPLITDHRLLITIFRERVQFH